MTCKRLSHIKIKKARESNPSSDPRPPKKLVSLWRDHQTKQDMGRLDNGQIIILNASAMF